MEGITESGDKSGVTVYAEGRGGGLNFSPL